MVQVTMQQLARIGIRLDVRDRQLPHVPRAARAPQAGRVRAGVLDAGLPRGGQLPRAAVPLEVDQRRGLEQLVVLHEPARRRARRPRAPRARRRAPQEDLQRGAGDPLRRGAVGLHALLPLLRAVAAVRARLQAAPDVDDRRDARVDRSRRRPGRGARDLLGRRLAKLFGDGSSHGAPRGGPR